MFESGNAVELAGRMSALASLPKEARSKMGDVGFELSEEYRPDRWADKLVVGIEELNAQRKGWHP